MGWGSGSSLYGGVIDVLKKHVRNAVDREAIHRELISLFEDEDCDTLNECLGEDKAFDKAFREMYPVDYDE